MNIFQFPILILISVYLEILRTFTFSLLDYRKQLKNIKLRSYCVVIFIRRELCILVVQIENSVQYSLKRQHINVFCLQAIHKLQCGYDLYLVHN